MYLQEQMKQPMQLLQLSQPAVGKEGGWGREDGQTGTCENKLELESAIHHLQPWCLGRFPGKTVLRPGAAWTHGPGCREATGADLGGARRGGVWASTHSSTVSWQTSRNIHELPPRLTCCTSLIKVTKWLWLHFDLPDLVQIFLVANLNQKTNRNGHSRKCSSSPGWCGSVDWAPAYEPKGHWFDSQAGHVPRLQARSPVGGVQEATTHWCFPPSLSLPPPLSKNTIK